MQVYDELVARGLIAQVTNEDEIREMVNNGKATFYIGFDPTADSLHVGHFVALMAMAHMQQAGHRPIVLLGGGTGMVGDPSGKTDMRKMLTTETIDHNVAQFRKQIGKFLDFSEDKPNGAIMVDNGEWLRPLNYIDFLREVGAHFSVNRMLTAECYKRRMEKGLTFLEFNYMLMQGYDFLRLNQDYGCQLQMGGDDQWSNMLAGADLIRRKEGKPAYAMTFTLLLTSDGHKMGKTAKGALWLDENKTSPYEFYQYFRNVEDVKVNECMRLLTFMELEEIEALTKHMDERMNAAKERLAFEVTRLVHGEEKALEAQRQARAAFGGGSAEDMPAVTIPCDTALVADALVLCGQAKSKGEAKRLIEGGGVMIDDAKITDPFSTLDFVREKGAFVLHKGKKIHIKVTLG